MILGKNKMMPHSKKQDNRQKKCLQFMETRSFDVTSVRGKSINRYIKWRVYHINYESSSLYYLPFTARNQQSKLRSPTKISIYMLHGLGISRTFLRSVQHRSILILEHFFNISNYFEVSSTHTHIVSCRHEYIQKNEESM